MDSGPLPAAPRSARAALVDVAVVIAVFVVARAVAAASGVGLPGAVGVATAVVAVLAVQRARGEPLRALGFTRPPSLLPTIGDALATAYSASQIYEEEMVHQAEEESAAGT